MNESFLLYRGASTDGATHLDLIIAVYDGLARDLDRIAKAVSNQDIEGRCRLTRHALLLLGYLETWVDSLHEPELQRSLNVFYRYLRSEILRLQVAQEPSSFYGLAMMVCETRAVWQQRLNATTSSKPHTVHNSQTVAEIDASPRSGWSA